MYMVSVATTRFYHCSSKGTIFKKKKKQQVWLGTNKTLSTKTGTRPDLIPQLQLPNSRLEQKSHYVHLNQESVGGLLIKWLSRMSTIIKK